MKYFDPHIHVYSRTVDDYKNMATAGVRAIVEPSFWLGSKRQYPESHLDYFEHVLSFEPKRAREHGIEHYACLGMNPKEANDLELAHAVIDALPEFLKRDNCVAIGETGFDLISKEEEEIMRRQLRLAKDLNMPVMVHTPHQNKREGTIRTVEILKEEGLDPNQVILDHNTHDTIDVSVEYGGWSGMTIYPGKISIEGVIEILERYGTERMMINTAADWGPADPLSVPKAAHEMLKQGYAEENIQRLVWDNPIQYYKQSGKLKLKEGKGVTS